MQELLRGGSGTSGVMGLPSDRSMHATVCRVFRPGFASWRAGEKCWLHMRHLTENVVIMTEMSKSILRSKLSDICAANLYGVLYSLYVLRTTYSTVHINPPREVQWDPSNF